MLGRLQTGGAIRKAQARIDATLTGVQDLHVRTAKWLDWVRGLRWTQADLLQVMEELEPKARDVLQTYFILRAGLSAAAAQVTERLAEWLPERPPDVTWGLYVGLADMPGIESAYALAVAARDEASRDPALARFGHRGPGEMRPDGMRWADQPALLASLADQRPQRNSDTAHIERQAVEAWVFGQLDASKSRQFEAALRRAQALCVAADVAWDAATMVMAAAQRWAEATASEATSAGLIARPADVLYLELEELKQVATGEWHPGRSAAVQDEVARRRAQIAGVPAGEAGGRPLPAGPGQAHGPAYLALAGGRAAPAVRHLADRGRRPRLRAVLARRRRGGDRGGRSLVTRPDHRARPGHPGRHRRGGGRVRGAAGADGDRGWRRGASQHVVRFSHDWKAFHTGRVVFAGGSTCIPQNPPLL